MMEMKLPADNICDDHDTRAHCSRVCDDTKIARFSFKDTRTVLR